MHGSYHHVQIGVLDMVQLFLQVVGVVVVHDSERAHNDSPRHRTLVFYQRFAHQIAYHFAAVFSQTAARHQMVELDQQVFGHRHRKAH